jgi:hypothetical protein
LPSPRVLPGAKLILSRLSASFFWPTRFSPDRQSHSSVLMHSSNLYLFGNCDSPRSETSLSYLTRLGTVSHRSSPPSSFFALLTRANVSEELVNSASANLAIRFKRGTVNQPDLAFPRSPGIILGNIQSRYSLHRLLPRPITSLNSSRTCISAETLGNHW